MSGTVNSHESESTALLNIAGNLLSVHVCNIVGSPFLSYGPSHVSNPVLCSKSRNSTVSITRVLQDLVAVYELGINPVSGILLGSVVNVVLAEIPLR